MARYVEILFRFKVRFALLLVLAPVLVGAITVLLFPSYKASAQLWVDNASYFGVAQPSGWNQYLTPAQNESDDLNQILSTRQFTNQLYRRLSDDIPDAGQRAHAVAIARIGVQPTGTHLVTVTGACERAATCVLLVSKSIDLMRDMQIDNEKSQARAGVAFVTTQLQQAKTSLSSSEDTLRKYLAAHPGARLETDPAAIADPELSRLASDVQQKRSKVNDLQQQLDRDNNIVSVSTAVISSGPQVVDPAQVSKSGVLGDGSSLKKAAASAGATLAVGLLYLLLVSWLDTTLRDPRDIEHRFKVPVVTTIPELQPSERF